MGAVAKRIKPCTESNRSMPDRRMQAGGVQGANQNVQTKTCEPKRANQRHGEKPKRVTQDGRMLIDLDVQ
jgi:hypothetical protein